jgi:flagellar biosynthesis protein FlhB
MLRFSGFIYPEMPGNFAGTLLFVFYLVVGAISLWVYINLYNYSKSLQRFLESGQEMHAEKAFEWQKRFWVFIGVMLIIYLAFMALALVIGVFAGLMSLA